MTQYERSLIAMKRLLDAVGEPHWAEWIETDIEQWRAEGGTSHHLQAYGGMGSFNDVVISRANKHHVTKMTEGWANALFEWLKTLCHFFAQHPTDSLNAESLSGQVGRDDPALAAFLGGRLAPPSMPGFASRPRVLQGWRCLRCGQSEVTDENLERFIAQDLIPGMVLAACAAAALDGLVDQVLNLDIPGIEETRRTLIAAAAASGILLATRDGWNRRCPYCGSDDTAAYRWNLLEDKAPRFVPSSDNLPLRQ